MFPASPLAIDVECAFGADTTTPEDTWTWTTVSGVPAGETQRRLLNEQIGMAKGRPNEGSAPDPGRCVLYFDNRDGFFTPYDDRSPWLPERGTPLRITLSGTGSNHLAIGGHAQAPDAAPLDIVGDLDVRVTFDPILTPQNTLQTALVSKWLPVYNQRSWRLNITQTGLLELTWTTAGSVASQITATSLLPIGRVERTTIRATLDVNNGVGGWTVRFYSANDANPNEWHQIGDAVTGVGVTSIYSGVGTMQVGAIQYDAVLTGPCPSRIYHVEVYDGIDGTLVADPDFSSWDLADGSNPDTTGNTWTLVTGEITDTFARFQGSIVSIVPTWPVGDISTETDRGECYVEVEVAGVLRRLMQTNGTNRSQIFRSMMHLDPVAYWPMEDDDDSTWFGSAVSGGRPSRKGPGMTLADDDSLPGSDPLPLVAANSMVVAQVSSLMSTGGWSVQTAFRAQGAAPVTPTRLLEVRGTTNVRSVSVFVESGICTVRHLYTNGTIDDDLFGLAATVFGGGWVWVQIKILESASTLWNYEVSFADSLGVIHVFTGSKFAFVGRVTGVDLHGLNWWHGHLSVTAPGVEIAALAIDGHASETAADRLVRLVDESLDIVTMAVVGDMANTEPMGIQDSDSLVPLLEECAEADQGFLFESRDNTIGGLVYRTRLARYNSLIELDLDASANDIAPPFVPVDDDQRFVNAVTASRRHGSSYEVADETSRQRYPSDVNLNVFTDSQLADQAGWRFYIGTLRGMRYPSVSLDLHQAPHLIPTYLSMAEGSVIRVRNLPPQHPAGSVDLIVEHIAETYGEYQWDVTLTCSPASPFDVGILEDTDDLHVSRLETDGSVLTANISDVATSFSVTTPTGPIYITTAAYPAEFPFPILVGGEEMLVTAISGVGPGQAFVVVRSTNGVSQSHTAGVTVALVERAILAM